jgi:hypothetical protein
MSAPFDPVADIEAPLGAVGWSVSRGWITDRQDVLAAHDEARDVIYLVPQDRIVRDVIGQASLLTLMHLDTRMLALRRELDELREGLLDVGEALVTTLARAPRGDGQ